MCVCVCVCAATHQFVHEIWVRAGGEQLSAGQGLVSKRVVLKGVPKGRLHPTDAGLQQDRQNINTEENRTAANVIINTKTKI